MFHKFLLKIFIILIIPIFLFSDNIPTTPIKLLTKEVTTPKLAEPVITEDNTLTIEEQINAQKKLVDEIIDNINKEIYLTTLPDKSYYDIW